jgi:predicted thioredoxin/glutaredoxin
LIIELYKLLLLLIICSPKMRSFIFKELDKAKIVEELLKFISNVKSDLDIIFPYNVHHLLLNQEIANMIVNKKLNGNIIIKLLY